MLCEKCIKELLEGVSKEEILLLEELNKKKRINVQTSLGKNALIALLQSSNITNYKINNMLDRLVLIKFLIRTPQFPATFYLSETGKKALELFKGDFK